MRTLHRKANYLQFKKLKWEENYFINWILKAAFHLHSKFWMRFHILTACAWRSAYEKVKKNRTLKTLKTFYPKENCFVLTNLASIKPQLHIGILGDIQLQYLLQSFFFFFKYQLGICFFCVVGFLFCLLMVPIKSLAHPKAICKISVWVCYLFLINY